MKGWEQSATETMVIIRSPDYLIIMFLVVLILALTLVLLLRAEQKSLGLAKH